MTHQDRVNLSREHGLTQIAPEIDFTGKNVVLTGGAAGIGGALAEAYHAFGANVIVIDVQDEKLKALEDKLGNERITGIAFDLRTLSKAKYAKLTRQIKHAAGNDTIDVYAINAGVIKLFDGPDAEHIATTPIQEMDSLFAINVRSHVTLYQQLLPMMKHSDAGRIMLTSSPIVGRKDPASANYAWTKKALEDYVAMFQQELATLDGAEHIQVAGYVPPPVQAWLRAHWKNEPLYANAMPEDVVELPLRLSASAMSADYNGKMFTFVDKRTRNITPADGGEKYDANARTENGFDLGIRVRDLGEGGGTAGEDFETSYDTWNSRLLLGKDPVPPLDENIRIREALAPPQFIKKAMNGPS